MKIIQSFKGFSLVEILLSAAILVYCLSMILSSYKNTVDLNYSSRNASVALSHAEYVMEEIKNASFASIASSITNGNWNWSASTITSNGLTALNGESIAVTCTGTTLLDVTVTVSWNDLNGRSRSKSLRTLISS